MIILLHILTHNECTQPPTDWQLLLAVGLIVLVDVCITVPLLTLAPLKGDFTLVPDKENPPRLNVSCVMILAVITDCILTTIPMI